MPGFRMKRELTLPEKELAKTVFERSLPLDRIYITNSIGLGNLEYVTPELKHDGGWILHMGTLVDQTTLDKPTFIHELMHVWQSYYGPYRWGYVANSLCHRYLFLKFDKAYDYVAGKTWREYTVEQQATIIEDWFRHGSPTSDTGIMGYSFVRDHIRPGIN